MFESSCAHCASDAESMGYTLRLSSSGRKLNDKRLCPAEWDLQTSRMWASGGTAQRIEDSLKAAANNGVSKGDIEGFKERILLAKGDQEAISQEIETFALHSEMPAETLTAVAEDLTSLATHYKLTFCQLKISEPLNSGARF